MNNYLENLNEEQRKPVLHTEGPLMVIAGAGSGKTRVLTYKIIHLLKKGVSPFNILALTFTNKAAKEMKERISKLTNDNQAKSIWMGTFHSVFARILRSESELIGFPSNFTIYDSSGNGLAANFWTVGTEYYELTTEEGELIRFNQEFEFEETTYISTNYLNNNYPVLRKINKNTIITSVDREKKNPFKMTFPKNKQQFINLIKQTNFKIKDIGHYSFKILNNFEKEDIFILENQ